jgi:hypothetical protein
MFIEEIKNSDGRLDFRAMANALSKSEGIRWAEACLEIKKRYPESRAFFGAPPPAEATAR